MARKTLLNESEIRKFLKLANITTVGDQKIHEMGAMPGGAYGRDDDMEEEDPMEMGAEGPDDEMDVEELPPEEGPEDLGVEEPEGDLGVDGLDVTGKEELMADVVRAVADALGISDRVDVEAGEEDAMDDMDDLDAEPMDMEPEAALVPDEGGEQSLEEPVDLGDEEDEEEIAMMEEEEDQELSEDDIVAEVARRVASRLQVENNKEKMVDALAERIMKRLTK